MEKLQKFQSLLKNNKQKIKSSTSDNDDNSEEDYKSNDDNQDEVIINQKHVWLTHKMNCTGEDEIVLARDANIRKEEDWYDIYDPRNPINKRRREGGV